MILADLNIVDWVLIGILFLLFVAEVYFYARYLAAPSRCLRPGKKAAKPLSEYPGVSILVCARNESVNLSAYLEALLTQDYPTYDVIVVDDGSEDNTHDVIEAYMLRDDRLHTTFVPRGARVRSTKKLALTLAAKAAQYDYLLLTDADCVPASNQWIRRMIEGFADAKTDIVLGYGAYFDEPGFVNRLVRYDTLFNGLHYLGAALCGHPYMGVGRNLAYRKSLFFETGGFSHLMDNPAGDDDLFVNHLATKENTAVVLVPSAYTWSPSKTVFRDWFQQKRRHLSVSPSYRESTKMRLTLEPLCRGLFYCFTILLIYLGCRAGVMTPKGWMLLGSALLFFVTRWVLLVSIINASAQRMRQVGFTPFAILGMDIFLPLVSLWMLCVPQPKGKKW